jgi:hypothetical protein
MITMTREEHMNWCKERAKNEMTFYKRAKEGIISMISDLSKHPDTINHPAKILLTMELMSYPNMSIEEATNLIDGCN